MNQKEPKDKALKLAISLAILGVIAIFFPFDILDGIQLWKYNITIGDYDKLAAFISGVASPFLSLSAFILLYITYSSQKKELKETKQILQNQSDLVQKQQFETTFFNLMDVYNKLVNSIKLTKVKQKGENVSETQIIGKPCFYTFFKILKDSYKEKQKEFDNNKTDIELIDLAYSESYKKIEAYLGHYFRIVYQILKFIENSNIKDKKTYSNILRAQLSTYELLFLYFDGLSHFGYEKLKPLIEEYSLLKHISEHQELLVFKTEGLYEKSAFGK